MKLRLPHHQAALGMIRDLAGRRDTDYELSSHAQEEMNDDCIDLLDIRSALLNANSAVEQAHDGFPIYLVTGTDANEKTISIVVDIEEHPPEDFRDYGMESGKEVIQ